MSDLHPDRGPVDGASAREVIDRLGGQHRCQEDEGVEDGGHRALLSFAPIEEIGRQLDARVAQALREARSDSGRNDPRVDLPVLVDPGARLQPSQSQPQTRNEVPSASTGNGDVP